MNYWEIRLGRDLWRAAESSWLRVSGLCMGSVPRLALLWTGVRAVSWVQSLAMRVSGFLHQKYNIIMVIAKAHPVYRCHRSNPSIEAQEAV